VRNFVDIGLGVAKTNVLNRRTQTAGSNNLRYLENGARYDLSLYESLIGSRIWAFYWYKNQ